MKAYSFHRALAIILVLAILSPMARITTAQTALTSPAAQFILGPQAPVGTTWFDTTQIERARVHGQGCPATPPTDPDELNQFVLLFYYDLPLTEYGVAARTGDVVFLEFARKCADAWWKHPTWIGEGKIRKWPDEASPPPRHAGVAGLILRAIDGRPEMWDWINSYTRYFFDLYVKRRLTLPLYDLREGAFALHFATMLAKVLPDSFPLQSGGTATNGAELRARYLADVESAVVQYFGRTQRADGAWVWNDDWKDSDGGSLQGVMQPFMVGLLLSALCDVHQLTQNATVRENVKNQILKGCRHLYSDGPYIKDQIEQKSGKRVRGFHYFYHGGTTVNPTRYANGDIKFPWTAAEEWYVPGTRQAISTILPAFGYAYRISGDSFFKTAGDELFDSAYGGGDGVRSMAADTAKNYNQHYRMGSRMLVWLPVAAPSPPVKTPSSDPTKATSIVDSQGTSWTLGAQKQTLRDGVHMGGGAGSIYKFAGGIVYVLGTDNNWYRWAGAGWTSIGTTEPGITLPSPTPTPNPSPIPSPAPVPSPSPSPIRLVIEWSKWSLPSSGAGKDALLKDVGEQGYSNCFVTSSVLYCSRVKQ